MTEAAVEQSASPQLWVPPGLRVLESSCHICMEDLNNPLVTSCGHVFCHGCITQWYRAGIAQTRPVACPECRHELWIPSDQPDDTIDTGESDDAEYGQQGPIEEETGEVRNWSTVLKILQSSGVLDGSYSAGANVQVGSTNGTQWNANVNHAAHYFINPGPLNIPSAPAVIRSEDSARDVVIFGNLLVAAYELQLPDLRQDAKPYVRGSIDSHKPRHLRKQWDYIVTKFAVMLHNPAWDRQKNSASAMIERLEEAVILECERHYKDDVFESMTETAWFGDEDWAGCRFMLNDLAEYVVNRAVHRRMGAIIAQA